MEVRRALALFKIEGRIPIDELNAAFRSLVKKYHPDKVRDYPEWAHERMAEINDAYETLASWIAKSREQTPEQNDVYNETETEEPADFKKSEDIPEMEGRLGKEFENAYAIFLDGLGLYYQYGLENPSYRTEGVRRFRYRESLRTAKRGRDILEDCASETRHPVIRAVARFSRLSIADMDLGFLVFSETQKSAKKMDERFKAAKKMFDEAVKVYLFPELVPNHLHAKVRAGLYSCYTEFVIYLTMFPKGERRKAAILAAARYDAFMDLIELRNAGRLDF